MHGSFSIVLGAASATLVAACASTQTVAHPRKFATSPERAAIGFETSIRANKAPVDYDCSEPGVFYGGQFVPLDGGSYRATAIAVRMGNSWRVTVTYGDASGGGSESYYEVVRQQGGYCVSAELEK